MQHVISWTHRYNGEYKKTAPFTIGKDGVIYKHFNPKYQSLYFNDLDLDKNSILILLENDGWLIKMKNKIILFHGWVYIYNGKIFLIEDGRVIIIGVVIVKNKWFH
jgi:hypothetical protein